MKKISLILIIAVLITSVFTLSSCYLALDGSSSGSGRSHPTNTTANSDSIAIARIRYFFM